MSPGALTFARVPAGDLCPGGTGQIALIWSISSRVLARIVSSVQLVTLFQISRFRKSVSCLVSVACLPSEPSHAALDSVLLSRPVRRVRLPSVWIELVALGFGRAAVERPVRMPTCAA